MGFWLLVGRRLRRDGLNVALNMLLLVYVHHVEDEIGLTADARGLDNGLAVHDLKPQFAVPAFLKFLVADLALLKVLIGYFYLQNINLKK